MHFAVYIFFWVGLGRFAININLYFFKLGMQLSPSPTWSQRAPPSSGVAATVSVNLSQSTWATNNKNEMFQCVTQCQHLSETAVSNHVRHLQAQFDNASFLHPFLV